MTISASTPAVVCPATESVASSATSGMSERTRTEGTSVVSRARLWADVVTIRRHPTAPRMAPRRVQMTMGPGVSGTKSSPAPSGPRAIAEITRFMTPAITPATAPVISAAPRLTAERRVGAEVDADVVIGAPRGSADGPSDGRGEAVHRPRTRGQVAVVDGPVCGTVDGDGVSLR